MLNIDLFSGNISYLVNKIDYFFLKKRGLKIGKNVFLGRNIYFDIVFPFLITIGDGAMITAETAILAHDSSTYTLGYTRIGKVEIGARTFIGTRCIILPGTKIGSDVIIGCGSVVTSDIPDNVVAAGNPAKIICDIDQFKAKHKALIEQGPLFEFKSLRKIRSENEITKFMEMFETGQGYIFHRPKKRDFSTKLK
jgi:maltose O-acetyltransferase